ncbi:MAG TPA: HupE/UreJ family protein [Chromatiales bacterium]|nr:HupE/UreJ family protein [Chromatiales bacterium]
MLKKLIPGHFLQFYRLVLFVSLLPVAAFAHQQGVMDSNAFVMGFTHPFGGIDHLLAILAVGMWGTLLGMPALWMLPVAFPMLMAIGGVAGILGLPVPGIELGIALSVIVLGAVILFAFRPPLGASLLIVSFFALFHGYAHGIVLPQQTDPLGYSLGFVVATGLIHITGILIGFIARLPYGVNMLRLSGGIFSAAGVYLLISL